MNNLLRLCSILLLVCWCDAQTPFDNLVDEILWETEQQMINQSKTTVPLPDIDMALDKRFLFWNIKGDLITKGGSISNMSSIRRIGDVTPVQYQDLIITATFGMSDLSLHFDQIKLDFLLFHFNDGLDLKITENALSFNVSFHYDNDGNCQVILNKAEVTTLGGFHTTLLPTGFFHDIEDWMITATLDIFSSLMKKAVNSHITSMLNGVIQQLDLCSKLPF